MCHLHQSISFWPIREILDGFKKLKSHNGFPTGLQCECPVITQDKYQNLSSSRLFFNPTLKISIPFQWRQEEILEIQFFLLKVNEGKGWIVKKPFVTNTKVVFCISLEEVLMALDRAGRNNSSQIYYVIIQLCMVNRKEYRVVCLNSEPIYIANIMVFRLGYSFSVEPHVELFEFTRAAIKSLKSKRPGSFTESLLRVDIFQRRDGRLVVNEFENLEASYSSNWSNENLVSEYVNNFWVDLLTELLKKV
jgi:hypothetical protein